MANTEEKALGQNGLLYFWQQLKVMLAGKVDKVEGKGLSTNDFTAAEKAKLAGIAEGATKSTNDLTNELKTNYDAAYTHSQVAHAPSDAQANVIEEISVNGTKQTVSGKAVNIAVPTTVAALSDAADYAKKSELTNVYKYQGSVATFDKLPATSTAGYIYNVEEDGMNYAWNGSGWDSLGASFSVSYITNAEIDAILAS